MHTWYKWVPCPECDGTCKVWITLKGAGIRTTAHCYSCIFGNIRVRMTKDEIREVLKADLAALDAEPAEKRKGEISVF